MTADFCTIIRSNSRPLRPVATNETPRLARIDGIRSVLFDVYGTMFISGSGDVGTAMETSRASALTAALTKMLVEFRGDAEKAAAILSKTIGGHHKRSREQGVEYPEVDITAVWDEVLDKFGQQDWIDRDQKIDSSELAVQFEVRANPVWPMPHVDDCLDDLRSAGMALGIVSNAQFFTLDLFQALLGKSLNELAFNANLCFYSYQYGQAKPGLYLYELARESLESRGIKPSEVLYIGNDMLNDVMPAQAVGFRTALFAGDGRSLRWRVGDERIRNIEADIVIIDLNQISDLLL